MLRDRESPLRRGDDVSAPGVIGPIDPQAVHRGKHGHNPRPTHLPGHGSGFPADALEHAAHGFGQCPRPWFDHRMLFSVSTSVISIPSQIGRPQPGANIRIRRQGGGSGAGTCCEDQDRVDLLAAWGHCSLGAQGRPAPRSEALTAFFGTERLTTCSLVRMQSAHPRFGSKRVIPHAARRWTSGPRGHRRSSWGSRENSARPGCRCRRAGR